MLGLFFMFGMENMRIIRIINNNVVCALNERHQERILTGKGVGFQKKPGDEVDKEKVEKEYILKSRTVIGRLNSLLAQLPPEYMEICQTIVTYAQEELGEELNENIYLTLIDHISFAVARYRKGLDFKNALSLEIKKFYSKEYKIALKALDIVEAALGIRLPEDEAASIALHIVNARMNSSMENTVRVTELIQKILSIVRYQYGIIFDEDSFHYVRFVTHLKFFAFRLFHSTLLEEQDMDFAEMVRMKYAGEYKCSQKIADLIKNEYQVELPDEEMVYLTLHIRRLTVKEKDGFKTE